MGVDILFPPLASPRQFGNANLPVGTVVVRSRGRVVYANVPTSWDSSLV